MRTGLILLATIAYFMLLLLVLFGAMLGNHGPAGSDPGDVAWKSRILIILVGGFAIYFGAVFAYWLMTRRGNGTGDR